MRRKEVNLNRRDCLKGIFFTTLSAAAGSQQAAFGKPSVSAALPAPKAGTFDFEAAAFDPKGGHIQGAAASDEALYLAQMTRICKFDWNGKMLKTLDVITHTGDVCWYDGCLYTSVAVYGGPNKGKGMIQVFDKNLDLQRETLIDRGTDGITLLDGTLYVGMGAKTQPSKEPHRVNLFGRFDPVSLKETAPRQEVDYGFETHYGAQNMLTDGKILYVNFYGAKGSPPFVAFDKDFKPLKTFRFGTGQGADFVPAARAAGKVRVFTIRTTGNWRARGDQPAEPPGARIQFYDFDGETFTAVK
jgi:hypothetical protein